MRRLNGTDVAEFIMERHAKQVRGLGFTPELAIIRQGDDVATSRYLRVKQQYGAEIGVRVSVHQLDGTNPVEHAASIAASATGTIIQLPLADRDLEDTVIASVPLGRDVDGLRNGSPYDVATPKAVLWLLASYDVTLKGRRIAVVGQGRLVGKPLADELEKSGNDVVRLDVNTPDLAAELRGCGVIITATGQPALITSAMVTPGSAVVDCGAPASELADDLRARTDVMLTPNPGGVGPMTVAALFDNLIIAAQNHGRADV